MSYPQIALLTETSGVCLEGQWRGWLFRKHADGQWVSEKRLEVADAAPPAGSVLGQLFAPSPAPAVAEPGWRVDAETVVVPSKMFLSKEAIASLVFQCGGIEDGDPDERWQDGMMWVGTLSDDDGSRSVHGLHVYSTEYPEDGSVTLATFKPRSALTSPKAEESGNG